MANRWWAGQVGLQGVETSSTSAGSPMKKPDLGISMNEVEDIHTNNNYDDDEPKEGAIELANRRPRGRPPGSKNKPKPPIFVTRDSPNTLRSHVMEVCDGSDVAESISQFSRRRQRGVCVMSATGTVVNVTLRQPSSAATVLALHGRFEILSLTGAFLPGPAPLGSTGLTIYLAGGQGQIVGGSVVGSLVASGPVMIIASTFSNAIYERLPLEDDNEEGPVASGGVLPDIGQIGSGTGGSPPGLLGLASGGNMGDQISRGMSGVYNSLPPNLLQNGGGQLNNSEDAFASWAHARPHY